MATLPEKDAETGQFIKKFSCPEELELYAEEYFSQQLAAQKPFTLAGLARALGFSRTDGLNAYRKAEGYEEYHDVASAAYLRVEEYTSEMCYSKAVNVAGPVFMLKNMGYKDKPDGQQETAIIRIEGVAAKL